MAGLLVGHFVCGVAFVVQSGALGVCRGSGVGGLFEGVYSSVLRGFQVLAVTLVFQLGFRLVAEVLLRGEVGRRLLEMGHRTELAAWGGLSLWGLLAGVRIVIILLLWWILRGVGCLAVAVLGDGLCSPG